MKIRMNEYFVLGGMYIALWVGISIHEPISWWVPICIGVVFTVPFVLGYLAGKDV